MASRWLHSIQSLFFGVYFLSLPAGAAAVADTRAPPSAHSDGASIGITDFLSLELVVLVGVVLLALVVIARSGKAP
jgi:hypothetical protein